MNKLIFPGLLTLIWCAMPCMAAHADVDTVNPMYITATGDLLSRTGVSYGNDIMRAAQYFAYGLNDRLSISADVHYQIDFDGREDGFSNVGLGGVYRLSGANDGNSKIISDALFGLKFGGSRRVREPEFADSIYYAGLRFGRQWNALTLAGTVKTSWIFDEDRGMAFIDFVPEAYIRITQNWMTGFGFQFRKATKPNYDQEWINFKLVRRYGRTQYVGHVDYEFESDDWQFGLRVNILF